MNDQPEPPTVSGELARVMHEHDHEAPSAADLLSALRAAPAPDRTPARAPGRRRYAPLAAAAAVAAVIAGSVWAGTVLTGPGPVISAGGHTAGSPPACPDRYAHVAPWVPARPSGVPASARLAPLRVPRSAVICAYDVMNTGPADSWRLSGRRVLRGGLTDLAGDLTWQPRKVPGQQIPCTLVGGPQVNYLIGLTYAGGGRLWVSATQDPNDCIGTSNGVFASFRSLGRETTNAFRSGQWPATKSPTCPPSALAGRLGQDRMMVPPGATSLVICGRSSGPTLTSGFGGLVSALDALPTRPSDRQCSMTSHGPKRSYELLFYYPDGPGVAVFVEGRCIPQVDNGSLQSGSAATILPIIERLLR